MKISTVAISVVGLMLASCQKDRSVEIKAAFAARLAEANAKNVELEETLAVEKKRSRELLAVLADLQRSIAAAEATERDAIETEFDGKKMANEIQEVISLKQEESQRRLKAALGEIEELKTVMAVTDPGVYIDVDWLLRALDELKEKIQEQEKEIERLRGGAE